MKEQTKKMLSEDAFFYRLVRVRAKSVQSFRHKIVVKLPYIHFFYLTVFLGLDDMYLKCDLILGCANKDLG